MGVGGTKCVSRAAFKRTDVLEGVVLDQLLCGSLKQTTGRKFINQLFRETRQQT